ncbi:MAG: hypothetical protein KDD64_08830 [Bdellovibrionales bacterium]|nr:hypothetical protein [Bdellovibrionales bacterium]
MTPENGIPHPSESDERTDHSRRPLPAQATEEPVPTTRWSDALECDIPIGRSLSLGTIKYVDSNREASERYIQTRAQPIEVFGIETINGLCSAFRSNYERRNLALRLRDPETYVRVAADAPVVDAKSFNWIEAPALAQLLQGGKSFAEQFTVYSNLIRPPVDPEVVASKQDAVRHVVENPSLRDQLGELRSFYDANEIRLFSAFAQKPDHQPSWDYYSKLQSKVLSLLDCIERIPEVESPYLNALRDSCLNVRKDSTLYQFLTNQIVRTTRGIEIRAESEEAHGWRYRPHPGSALGLPLSAGLMAIPPAIFALKGTILSGSLAGAALTLGSAVAAGLTFLVIDSIVKEKVDTFTVLSPLRDKAKADTSYKSLFRSVGLLLETLAYAEDALSMSRGTRCTPEVIDSDRFAIHIEGMRDPLAPLSPSYVPNSFSNFEHSIALIGGPNSGGKTRTCKDLTRTLLRGLNGGMVAAERFVFSPPDLLMYQGPWDDRSDSSQGLTLEDLEELDPRVLLRRQAMQATDGRYGNDIERISQAAYSASEHSFLLLDEASEGTTLEERRAALQEIIDFLYAKGSGLIMVTHDNDFVAQLAEKSIVQPLQIEFRDGNPTHRLIPGISPMSHAARIAERKGVSPAKLRDELRRIGAIPRGGRASH